MATERKRGDKGVARTELVAVRFDPRTKYLLEIAARAQHRSASSFIEEAVSARMDSVLLTNENGLKWTLQQQSDELWDVDAMDRFVKLAKSFPYLLDYEEQKLWKFVQETFSAMKEGGKFLGTLEHMEMLRRHGGLFQTAASGNFMPSEMARALNGDEEMMSLIVHMHEASQRPFATEHPTTTKEKAEAKAAKKASAKAAK